MRSFLTGLAVLLLGGCAADGNSGLLATGSVSQPYPMRYRELVQQNVKRVFADPYAIRDAEIAEPMPSGGPVLLPNGTSAEVWVVCVRTNSSGPTGAYTGVSTTAFLIHNNAVQDVWNNDPRNAKCNNLDYLPFPEINRRLTPT